MTTKEKQQKQDALWQLLATLGERRCAPKGTMLIRQGAVERTFFFLEQGLAKAYYESVDGRILIKSFIREGEIIASMQAIMAGQPSLFNLVTLENSQFLAAPGGALMEHFERNPAIHVPLNKLLAHVAMKKERREYEFLCLSAEQRYLDFCQNEPELIERISQADVARYLGITPVALSRIRRRRRDAISYNALGRP
ncbi:Crp/Fnr family transcriptional regulator [Billgrantia saliphila]|uniref:Crp/Fnr family transcriptional regulator n=1 Tax=Billgrantia saliphila TaxID=1848458 RepID=UPI000CE41492|nr:Crp/Fnr family transcriptional regulator [Halomonas saliphila]